MKKILVVAILAVCFMCNTGMCATVDLTSSCEYISESRSITKCTYESTTSIIQGASRVFDLTIPKRFGNIVGVGIESLSTDLDWYVSETEDATPTEIATVIWETETNLGISLTYGGLFGAPVYFNCVDQHMFLTLDNDGVEDVTTVYFYIVFGNSTN
jgi:DNA-directed RNA polymerase